MPKYITDVDRWLSHENRLVKAGMEFDTEFPLASDGKPMRLAETIRLVEEPKPTRRKPQSDDAEA